MPIDYLAMDPLLPHPSQWSYAPAYGYSFEIATGKIMTVDIGQLMYH